jgi:hypothetical protein
VCPLKWWLCIEHLFIQNQKEFNEALRRAIDLEKLVFGSPCSGRPGLPRDLIAINNILKFRPINTEH